MKVIKIILKKFFINLLVCASVFLVSCGYVDNSAVSHIPYDDIKSLLMFHHIVYEGTDYYMLDSEYDVPKEYIPFAEDKIYITLVDEEGDAYVEGEQEEAYLYQNDRDKIYIYFQSAPYTKDKSLALKSLGLD